MLGNIHVAIQPRPYRQFYISAQIAAMTHIIDGQTSEGVLLAALLSNRKEVVCFYQGVVLTVLALAAQARPAGNL